jgi:hypothetical protein
VPGGWNPGPAGESCQNSSSQSQGKVRVMLHENERPSSVGQDLRTLERIRTRPDLGLRLVPGRRSAEHQIRTGSCRGQLINYHCKQDDIVTCQNARFSSSS